MIKTWACSSIRNSRDVTTPACVADARAAILPLDSCVGCLRVVAAAVSGASVAKAGTGDTAGLVHVH